MPKVGESKNPGNAGRGRRKGSKNRITADLKAMIHNALDKVGGEQYLAKQAEDSPAAFLALLGKILPKELTGANGADLFPFQKVITELVRPKA